MQDYTQMPNEAIRRMNELTPGAWRLYCFLVYCRNRNTGNCNPSVPVCADGIGVHVKVIFKLRRELAGKKWATFNNNQALLAFVGKGNRLITTDNDTVQVSSDSAEDSNQKITTANTEAIRGNQKITKPGADSELSDTLKQDGNQQITGNQKITNGNQKITPSNQNITPFHVYEPEEYNQKKESEEQSVTNALCSEVVSVNPVKDIFAYWQLKLEHPQARLTVEREKKIKARLKTYSAEQVKLAIDGCAASPFYRGENNQNRAYDDIDLICRNDTKLEQFIEMATKPPMTTAKGNHNGIFGTGIRKTSGGSTPQSGSSRFGGEDI